MSSARARRGRGEDGVTLILFALAITGIMIVVALAIDLSNVRNTRQSNKSVADVSVAAGMRGLANGADGVPQPWGGVCKALDYLKLNHEAGSSITGTFKNGVGATVSDPCNPASGLYTAPCVADDASTWAWFDGSANGGELEIDIKNGYAMPDPDFAEDDAAYVGDNIGSAAVGPCGHLAVILREVDPAFFGGAAGANQYATVIRSVGRVTVGERSENPVALLLLEQTACRALYTSGNNTFVLVKSVNLKPGYIQVNSNGADCSGGQTVIEGSNDCAALAQDPGCPDGPSIVAQDAVDLLGVVTPGVVGNHALGGAFASSANSPTCPIPATPPAECTIGPTPTDRGVTTRAPVDNRFLGRVTTLKARAQAAINTASGDPSYFQVNGVGNCNNLQDTTISTTAVAPLPGTSGVLSTGGLTKVYLNCASGGFDTGANNTTIFDSTIEEVVIRGTMDVASNGTLRFDGVERLYIEGDTGTAVNTTGTLWVNGGSVPDGCTVRRRDAPTEVAEMVVMEGSVITTGGNPFVHLCNTFLFLADGSLPTTSGTDPADHTYGGGIDFGSQTRLDWSAPNQTLLFVDSTDPVYDKFEDLALWTESGNCANTNSPPTKIGGQGSVIATGVFFMPNACFTISGGGFGASVGADAQFVVRRLDASGTTQLSIAPNIANIIPIPFFESFQLIR